MNETSESPPWLTLPNMVASALNFIEGEWGLELTLIEKVRLKNDYVIPAIERFKALDNPRKNGFDPDIDAATLFLADYYGIPAYDYAFLNNFTFPGADQMMEYLKRLQEKAHLP